MIAEIPVLVTSKTVNLLYAAKRQDLTTDNHRVILSGLGWGGLYHNGLTSPDQPVQTVSEAVDVNGAPVEVILTIEHLTITVDMVNATVCVVDALSRATDEAPFFILRIRLPDAPGGNLL